MLALALLVLLPTGAAALAGRRARAGRRGCAQLSTLDGRPSLANFLAGHDARAQLLPAGDARCAKALALKTLLFACDVPGGFALAVLAEADHCDEALLAATLGVGRVSLAPRALAEVASGFVMGTLPPCGTGCEGGITVIDTRIFCGRPIVGGGGELGTRLLISSPAELERLAALGGAVVISAISVQAREPTAGEPEDDEHLNLAELPAVDVSGERVHIWGVVASKRPMARKLCFSRFCPTRNCSPPKHRCAPAGAQGARSGVRSGEVHLLIFLLIATGG
ncbi:hypothetical protein T492DRAFT_2220 [Pavlovales sp. CCMP2436]|nr:hypothetical protein T492DRAFT_2220 [Pavlovales sp. CCMP2436]